MIKPVSKNRNLAFINNFQVMKGKCAKTMENFGEPVSAAHEAHLLIRDDSTKLPAGEQAMYVIHHRSENRILKIRCVPAVQLRIAA